MIEGGSEEGDGMTPERRERILQIALELEEQGLETTNSAVYSRALGHRGDVVAVMRDRRASQSGGDVAVLEADDDEIPQPSAQELQEDLLQLTASYDAWHLALERLWEIEQEGPLSEQNFSRKQWLEYQMVQNLQAQERLQPQLDAARLTEAVYAAQATHDAGVAEAEAKARYALQLLGTLRDVWRELMTHFDAQQDGFVAPRDRRGHQAFAVNGGRSDALQLFAALFEGDFRGKDAFELLVEKTTTAGAAEQALANCPRLQPFSERAITTYLEGMTHASHA
jgi:hypothetical protein